MNSSRGFMSLSALFVITAAVITWSELKGASSSVGIGWPRPSRYVGLGVTFTLLGVLAEIMDPVFAAVIAAGLTVSITINTIQQNSSSQGSNSAGGMPSVPSAPTPGPTGISGVQKV